MLGLHQPLRFRVLSSLLRFGHTTLVKSFRPMSHSRSYSRH